MPLKFTKQFVIDVQLIKDLNLEDDHFVLVDIFLSFEAGICVKNKESGGTRVNHLQKKTPCQAWWLFLKYK